MASSQRLYRNLTVVGVLHSKARLGFTWQRAEGLGLVWHSLEGEPLVGIALIVLALLSVALWFLVDLLLGG